VEAEVNALIAMGNRSDGWKPSVVRTVASAGEGIDACVDAIEAFRQFQNASAARRERKIHIQKERLLELVRSQVTRQLLRDRRGAERLEQLAARIADRDVDPYSAAEELLTLSRDLKERRKE
jgi:LAO/AO transport system kinase